MKSIKFLGIEEVGFPRPSGPDPLKKSWSLEGLRLYSIESESKPTPETAAEIEDLAAEPALDEMFSKTVAKFKSSTVSSDYPQTPSSKIDVFEMARRNRASRKTKTIVGRAVEFHEENHDSIHIPASDSEESMHSPNVMLVEDDNIIAGFLVHLLSRRGFKVHLADDGRKATKMLDEIEPPKMVILDIMLPFVDGFELIKRVRAKQGWETIPIMMLTSKTQEQDIVRALDNGANDYVVKPFQSQEFIARVDRFLR